MLTHVNACYLRRWEGISHLRKYVIKLSGNPAYLWSEFQLNGFPEAKKVNDSRNKGKIPRTLTLNVLGGHRPIKKICDKALAILHTLYGHSFSYMDFRRQKTSTIPGTKVTYLVL